MHLTFLDNKIRSICEKERKGRAALGESFDNLCLCLVELMAAKSIDDLPDGYVARAGNDEIFFAIGSNKYLVAKKNRSLHISESERSQGNISLQILRVEQA
jgi:hypothetical protein